MSLRNLYRYAAGRSLDTFSLLLAIAPIGLVITADFWQEAHITMQNSRAWLALFIGCSVTWILLFPLMLRDWGTQGQWGNSVSEEYAPRFPSLIKLVAFAVPIPVLQLPFFRTALSVFSAILIGAVIGVFASGLDWSWLTVVLGSSSTVIFLLAVFYWMCRMAYSRVSPEEYASLALGGRKVEEMFRWIAWEMYNLCSGFLDSNTLWLNEAQGKLLKRLSIAREDVRSNSGILIELRSDWTLSEVEKLNREIDQLELRLLGLRMGIRRCVEMKRLAAGELAIHDRRLCDYIFRFSPSIFERRVSKYVRNWRTIARSLAVTHAHIPAARLTDLVQENERIVKRIGRRANYLRLIAGSTGIFEDVRAFASTASVGESLAAYASVITRITEGAASGRSIQMRRAQLASAYLMQQAHPGIDLHRALMQLCRGGAPWCEDRISELNGRAAFLKSKAAIDGDPKWENARDKMKKKCINLEKNADMWRECTSVLQVIGRDAGHSSTPIESLDILRQLDTLVSAATHNTQWEINNKMRKQLLWWLRDRPNVLIMTYGNSRVVRDVLKCVAMPLLERKVNEPHSDRIFIARTEADDFESRMMAFALREDRRWYSPGNAAELGYGDDTLLMSLIRDLDEHDLSVMILLGAESFDSAGRIVQLASAHKQIRLLKKRLKRFNLKDPQRVMFVAVAESYKESPDLSRETGFYRDHLDHVALYPAGVIDLIVSNNATYQITQLRN